MTLLVKGFDSIARSSQIIRSASFIDGDVHFEDTVFFVHDPATSKVIAEISDANDLTAKVALRSSLDAFEKFKTTSKEQRVKVLKQVAKLLNQFLEPLARIITSEAGKPLDEARAEVQYGASYFDWFSNVLESETKLSQSDDGVSHFHEPVGVCVGITPWNFPLAMVARKVAPAIAAGCSIIIKPSELTPLSALLTADICRASGLPPGVLNVITGKNAQRIVETWHSATEVRKISFTGSTRVGKLLIEASAANVQRLSLELGGNAPFVVNEDADLSKVINWAVYSKFRNAGQACVATNRFLVHENIYDEFLMLFSSAIKVLKVGNGIGKGVSMGPLINQEAANRVYNLQCDAVDRGAKLLGGEHGKPISAFYKPAILANCQPESLCLNEEIFGPLAPVVPFKNIDEAIEMANATPYGLAAYMFSETPSTTDRFSRELNVGMIGINKGSVSSASAAFGGNKHSGYGREGGLMGLTEYQQTKALHF